MIKLTDSFAFCSLLKVYSILKVPFFLDGQHRLIRCLLRYMFSVLSFGNVDYNEAWLCFIVAASPVRICVTYYGRCLSVSGQYSVLIFLYSIVFACNQCSFCFNFAFCVLCS